jgi:cation diffusion facilitator family transporter
MINQLIKWFIKDYQETTRPVVRERYGRLAGIVGIISNVILFALKLIVGTLFNSISITADAVNNLSDAGSSVITLVGFKLSSKPADEKHPYGHARAEYITGFIVSVVILLLGLELIKSSFEKILNPDPVNYSYIAIIVLIIAILVKLWQSLFNRTLGKRIHSTALVATSMDSMNDVIATSAVLVAALVSKFTGLQIDGYMGVIVALFILYSGFRLVSETLNPLLGVAPDEELVSGIEKRILSYKGVLGFHDLVVHNYGADNYFASVHVEVPAHQDLLESHDLIDIIEKDILTESNIHLVIHMDPIVNDDELINILRQQVNEIVIEIDPKLSMHDFRVVAGKTHSNLIFDVSVPSSYRTRDDELRDIIQRGISRINPTYHSVITVDRNYTSTTNL